MTDAPDYVAAAEMAAAAAAAFYVAFIEATDAPPDVAVEVTATWMAGWSVRLVGDEAVDE